MTTFGARVGPGTFAHQFVTTPGVVAIIDGVLAGVNGATLTGHRTERLPNNASFVIAGTDGTSLIAALDMAGFAVSSGSACTSGDTEPSHVILALGIERELAKGSLRVTVGRSTTVADVDAFLAALPGIVSRVRGAAPVSA
jgi:cysteine desulfurase